MYLSLVYLSVILVILYMSLSSISLLLLHSLPLFSLRSFNYVFLPCLVSTFSFIRPFNPSSLNSLPSPPSPIRHSCPLYFHPSCPSFFPAFIPFLSFTPSQVTTRNQAPLWPSDDHAYVWLSSVCMGVCIFTYLCLSFCLSFLLSPPSGWVKHESTWTTLCIVMAITDQSRPKEFSKNSRFLFFRTENKTLSNPTFARFATPVQFVHRVHACIL